LYDLEMIHSEDARAMRRRRQANSPHRKAITLIGLEMVTVSMVVTGAIFPSAGLGGTNGVNVKRNRMQYGSWSEFQTILVRFCGYVYVLSGPFVSDPEVFPSNSLKSGRESDSKLKPPKGSLFFGPSESVGLTEVVRVPPNMVGLTTSLYK